ncbi:MAG: cyclohexanone monooxygenase [Homoserinimonas sp.]|nr:cyclohexanone monooxygenase [Homoserinimonas sp.]
MSYSTGALENSPEPLVFDVVVVGAGFAGLYMLHKLRELGFTVRVLEAASGVGGTWFHNRYPGARCDIESLDYSYSFSEELQQEWSWSERYASQPEILRYIDHVAERFDLLRDVQLNTVVANAEFEEHTARWSVTTEEGERYSARFCIMATGVLSAAQVPRLAGLEEYTGRWYHTGAWPHERPDFTGMRVGVIGTGSSGTQLIPLVAQQAKELVVFQRTANYCMPAQNRPLDANLEGEWKTHYPERRAFARASSFGHNQVSNDKKGTEVSPLERREELERRWDLGGLYMMRAFKDIMTNADVNREAIEFVHEKIDGIVNDPQTAEALKPKDLFIGTKRLCSGTDYYETFNRQNVRLVDVKSDPIKRVTPTGLQTEGETFALDAIIFATGFDAMTGSLLRINPTGRGGVKLSERWADGPRSYLGLSISGFPNMFVIAGAGSPSVFSNMVTSIEQHVEWIATCLLHLERNGAACIEATPEAEEGWVQHVNELADKTLYRHSKNTWFYGANTPGKPVVFMPYVGGVGRYSQNISSIAAKNYEGFSIQERVDSSL